MNNPKREKIELLVIVLSLIVILFLGEVVSLLIVKDIDEDNVVVSNRAQDVIVIPKGTQDLPESDKTRTELLLIGNSHTYALPGLQKGLPLRPDSGVTLIDNLADKIRAQNSQSSIQTNFYRLSFPNFLPYEMLTRVGNLIYHQHNPKVVVIGLTWRNIARDRDLRYEIVKTYQDKEFVTWFKRVLQENSVNAPAEILQAIENEERKAQFEEETERTRSYSDRLDEKITAGAGQKLTLLGRSEDLRARIYREFNYKVIGTLTSNIDNAPKYDVVKADMEFNLKCLQTLIRLLHLTNTTVVLYYAPERSDLPSLIDTTLQEQVMGDFKKDAEAQGCLVLDARHVVPNEYWGWDHTIPDRSHFTEPGHKLLAQFIYDEAAKENAWEALATN